jgi:hypothetical protein
VARRAQRAAQRDPGDSSVSRIAALCSDWRLDFAPAVPAVSGKLPSERMALMSAYRAQAHLDAPLEDVWALVGNPATYPEWWPAAVEIRGERFEVGDVYTQVVGIAGRRPEYSRVIDRRDELKELSWSCPTTGGFQRWLLTDAQGGTFVDMEMGIDAPTFRYGLFDKTVGRWFIKRWAEQAIDGLRLTLSSDPKA